MLCTCLLQSCLLNLLTHMNLLHSMTLLCSPCLPTCICYIQWRCSCPHAFAVFNFLFIEENMWHLFWLFVKQQLLSREGGFGSLISHSSCCQKREVREFISLRYLIGDWGKWRFAPNSHLSNGRKLRSLHPILTFPTDGKFSIYTSLNWPVARSKAPNRQGTRPTEVRRVQPTCISSWQESWSFCCRGSPDHLLQLPEFCSRISQRATYHKIFFWQRLFLIEAQRVQHISFHLEEKDEVVWAQGCRRRALHLD